MALKIYGLPGSTCTARVLATIFEKNVDDFVIEPVNLATGAHKKPEFLKMQPFGQIPVLQDGELKLFESRAIARYISEKYKEQGTCLVGKTTRERALVNQWLEVEAHNFNPAVSAIVFQLVFAPGRGLETDEKVVNKELAKLEKVLNVYDDHLALNKYLAGDFFSLADLSHMSYAHHLVSVAKKGKVITSRKHVNAWWEDISSRPSWQKVLELRARKW